jgi:hypothetical protein
MQNDELILNRMNGMEDQLREISDLLKQPEQKFNLMVLRVDAYRKINSAVAMIDRLLEIIETQYETIDQEETSSLIFLNKHQEEQHNSDFQDVCYELREIRGFLTAPPENYQDVSENLPVESGTS